MAVPRYHFDLYPRDDPRDGTRLVRFTNLQSAKFRLEANGVGVGEFSIRASDPEALFIDPRGLQYVRVVEEGITETERVVGGFWLETGDFAALTEDSTKLLKFVGPGTLAYTSREILWSRAYAYAADGIIRDDTWHFYQQPSLAGGDFLGGVAFRIITEGLSFTGSPSEPDDKADTAIPFVQLGGGLGAYTDSAGNAWTVPSGEFKAQVQDTLYSVLKRLMEAGLYVEMNPDTFELNVWERGAADSRGDDKTGSAWAVVDPMTDARVIRFQSAPLDGDEAEGNVKSDAKRSITPYLLASTVLAGDKGVYAAESNALDVPWHRGYPTSVADTDTLSYIAEAQLTARGDAADTLRVRMKLGNDPANGVYYPFEWEPFADTGLDGVVMVNDLVTVHTGTSQWDFNEDTFPVSAITISVREGSDWDCWLDLGAAYSSMAERAFQARGTAAHSHPPNPELCRIGVPAVPPSVAASGGSHNYSNGGFLLVEPLSVAGAADEMLVVFVVARDGQTTTEVRWIPNTGIPGTYQSFSLEETQTIGGVQVTAWKLSAPSATALNGRISVIQSGGNRATSGAYYLLTGVTDGTVLSSGSTDAGTAIATTLGSVNDGHRVLDAVGWQATHTASLTAAEGPDQTEVYQNGTSGAGGDPDAVLASSHQDGSDGGAMTWTIPVAGGAHVVLGIAGVPGTEGDCPQDVGHECSVGTSNRAARCDHVHAHGNLSASATHHHDADDIEDLSAGVTDHGALTGLADDDHPQYQTEAEVLALIAAAPYRAIVTDGFDTLVWEGDDLVWEWSS